MKDEKFKKRIGYFFFIILMVQIFLFNSTGYIYKESLNNNAAIVHSQVKNEEILIMDTIRTQQRYLLSSIKQSWLQYIETFHKNDLIKKDNKGLPIYENKNTNISYDDTKMFKRQKSNNLFDVYDKKTNSLLAENVKPEWNIEEVQKILNILVSPIKPFGNNGGIVVFDSYSGNILLDTTPANRVINCPNLSIFEDDKNPLNKNKKETKRVIDNDLKIRKDTDRVSSLVYMFKEKTYMEKDAENFQKYPFGKYNRMFVEKIVLPYETIGFDGQPMQLTMLLGVAEEDISKAYATNTKELKEKISINKHLFANTTFVLMTSNILAMSTMLISLYVMKYSSKK